jgi:hypothetical protein
MSHLYQDVDIPIGTRSFMFYGEALRTTETSSNTVSGSLTKTVTGATLAGITFSPTPIHSTGTVGSNGTTIAQYLTAIAATTVNNKKWEETENVGLRALYESFISNKAGSWTNVKAMVQDMYKNLKPGSADNTDTQAMKNAIRTSIASSTYGVSASEEVLTFSQNMGNYPRDLGLPDGAAYVRWNATDKQFEALATNNNTGMNITLLMNLNSSLFCTLLSHFLPICEGILSVSPCVSIWEGSLLPSGLGHFKKAALYLSVLNMAHW